MEAERLVFWRVFLGGALVAIWLLFRGKTQRFPIKEWIKVALVGCAAAAHWIAFFGSIKASNVSVALATLATTPVFVSILEPLVHRRKMDWRDALLGAMIIVGLLVLLFGPGEGDFVLTP